MTQNESNLYEGMYIVTPTLSEEARKKALERLTKGITDRGGEVKKIHDLERKRLAYEIGGHKEGCYYLIYFDLPPTKMEDLWQDYHLNEDLLRFMTLRADNVMEELNFKTIEQPQ